MERFHGMNGNQNSETLTGLLPALARARLKFKPVEMSGNITGDEAYAYSTWADICQALEPHLLSEGLVFFPTEEYTVHGWVMTGRLYHAETGEWIESRAPIREPDQSDPRDWLAACTQARKGLYLELAGGYSRNPGEGKTQADEAPAAEKGPQLDAALEKELDAKRDQIIKYLKSCKDPAKRAEALAKAEMLCNEGKLRESDLQEIVKPYLEGQT